MSSIDFNTIDNLIIDGDATEYTLRGPLTPEQKTRTLNYLEEGFGKMLEQNPNSKDYITIATFTDGTQINEFYLPRQHFIDLEEKERPVTPPVRTITPNILSRFKNTRANLAAAAKVAARRQANINAAKAKAALIAKAKATKRGGKRSRRGRRTSRQTRRR